MQSQFFLENFNISELLIFNTQTNIKCFEWIQTTIFNTPFSLNKPKKIELGMWNLHTLIQYLFIYLFFQFWDVATLDLARFGYRIDRIFFNIKKKKESCYFLVTFRNTESKCGKLKIKIK